MRFTKEELLKIIKEEINNLAEQDTPRYLQGPTASGPNTTPRHLQGPTASGPAPAPDPNSVEAMQSAQTATGPADLKKKAVALDLSQDLLANLLKQLREV